MTATSTYSETPASNTVFGEADDADFERDATPEDSSLQSTGLTAGDWLRRAIAGARDYWVPPALLTEPPPSVAQLAAYAHRGPWTKERGHLRNLGIIWHRAVSLPATVVCRYIEWISQRPGRAIPALALWYLFASTGPGPWIEANLIHPALTFLI